MSPIALLPATTKMSTVVLEVRHLQNMISFYHGVVGLDVITEGPGIISLGRRAAHLGDQAVVVLKENRNLPLRPEGSAGLFHTAILFNDPRELAAALIRIAQNVPQLYIGSGDHAVSQAFYLDDPEGNGVELYVDRPRDQWQWHNGHVQMGTDYIDPKQFVVSNLPEADLTNRLTGNSLSLGHVHLQVGDIATAKQFYIDILGFDETARIGDSALFVSAGGYHHHMAMNTWRSAGAGTRSPSLGLGRVDIQVPNREAVESAKDRLASAGFITKDDGRSIESADPWGNLVRVAA